MKGGALFSYEITAAIANIYRVLVVVAIIAIYFYVRAIKKHKIDGIYLKDNGDTIKKQYDMLFAILKYYFIFAVAVLLLSWIGII